MLSFVRCGVRASSLVPLSHPCEVADRFALTLPREYHSCQGHTSGDACKYLLTGTSASPVNTNWDHVLVHPTDASFTCESGQSQRKGQKWLKRW